MLAAGQFTVAHAGPYGRYDLKEAFVLKQSDSGPNSITIKFPYLDTMLGDLAAHASNYPPRFDSPADQERARVDVGALSNLFNTMSSSRNHRVLTDIGIVNSIAFNFDIPQSVDRAVAAFSTLLEDAPEDPQTNYLFGKLLSTSARRDDGIRMLEKAKMLGVVQAEYVLGITYMTAGDKDKALENMEAYAKSVPADENAPKIIDAIKNGHVEIKKLN